MVSSLKNPENSVFIAATQAGQPAYAYTRSVAGLSCGRRRGRMPITIRQPQTKGHHSTWRPTTVTVAEWHRPRHLAGAIAEKRVNRRTKGRRLSGGA